MRIAVITVLVVLIVGGAIDDVFGHEAVVVPAANADGVIIEMCSKIAGEDAELFALCRAWAVKELIPLMYEHEHG